MTFKTKNETDLIKIIFNDETRKILILESENRFYETKSLFCVPKLFSDSDDSAGESGSSVSGGLAQLVTALTEVVDVGMDHLKNEIKFLKNIFNLTL